MSYVAVQCQDRTALGSAPTTLKMMMECLLVKHRGLDNAVWSGCPEFGDAQCLGQTRSYQGAGCFIEVTAAIFGTKTAVAVQVFHHPIEFSQYNIALYQKM